MVTLSKIYTRGGDKGETALGNTRRVPKTSARVAAYGTSDELNSVLGLAALHANVLADEITRIQNDLFDLGADLCTPPHTQDSKTNEEWALRITSAQVERLENEIDKMNTSLSVLKSFTLPGGTALAAHLHHARTVSRRAERMMWAAIEAGEQISEPALQYMNRLSDWFFVASRFANLPEHGGAGDVLWVPGANRT